MKANANNYLSFFKVKYFIAYTQKRFYSIFKTNIEADRNVNDFFTGSICSQIYVDGFYVLDPTSN